MGKLNMKLMQGVGAVENQIQKEKQKQSQEIKDDLCEPQTPHKTPKQSKARVNAKKRNKSENKPNMKPQKQVFSFRAMIADISIWKAYATASGKTMEYIGVVAMNEYIKRHKLNEAEQAVFEALKAREEQKGGR